MKVFFCVMMYIYVMIEIYNLYGYKDNGKRGYLSHR